MEEANKRAEQMEKLARIDQMTGLLNHHFFYKESQCLLEQKKTGYCMTIDLDDFKQINDSYGHQEGDAVLQEVGRMIRQAAGPGSVAGRTGGDEFALFCTDLASDADACAVGEEILRQTDCRIRERKRRFPRCFHRHFPDQGRGEPEGSVPAGGYYALSGKTPGKAWIPVL